MAGLRRLQEVDDPSARTLLLRSPGGEIGVSMDFADWVRQRGLDVEIVDYCVSSCANYVFVAARTKRVLPGGAVAWHGNALQHDAVAQVDDMFSKPADRARVRAYLEAMRSKQAAFFARIGVNECICRIGDEQLGAKGLYSMSKADMERFGVVDVVDAPAGADEIAADVRRKLELTFVVVPPGFELGTVCP